MVQGRLGAASNTGTRAFTLFELVIVIVVLGIVAAVAIPRFASASTGYRLEAATDRIVQDLSLIAESAATQSRDLQVAFEPVSDRYVLMGIQSRGAAMYEWRDLGRDPYGVDLSSATFEDGQLLVFNGHGLPEDSGTVLLALGNDGRRIVLTAGASAVVIEDVGLADDGGGSVRQVDAVLKQATTDLVAEYNKR